VADDEPFGEAGLAHGTVLGIMDADEFPGTVGFGEEGFDGCGAERAVEFQSLRPRADARVIWGWGVEGDGARGVEVVGEGEGGDREPSFAEADIPPGGKDNVVVVELAAGVTAEDLGVRTLACGVPSAGAGNAKRAGVIVDVRGGVAREPKDGFTRMFPARPDEGVVEEVVGDRLVEQAPVEGDEGVVENDGPDAGVPVVLDAPDADGRNEMVFGFQEVFPAADASAGGDELGEQPTEASGECEVIAVEPGDPGAFWGEGQVEAKGAVLGGGKVSGFGESLDDNTASGRDVGARDADDGPASRGDGIVHRDEEHRIAVSGGGEGGFDGLEGVPEPVGMVTGVCGYQDGDTDVHRPVWGSLGGCGGGL